MINKKYKSVLTISFFIISGVVFLLFICNYLYYHLNIFNNPKIDCRINKQEEIILGYYMTENNACYAYSINYPESPSYIIDEYIIVNGINMSAFLSINERYAKDDKNVYSFFSGCLDCINSTYNKIMIIDGADPKTFKVLKYNWARDKGNVFYKHKKIEGVDIETFELLDNLKIKDKNYIFEITPSESSDEFEVLRVEIDNYIQNTNNQYKNGKILDQEETPENTESGISTSTDEVIEALY